MRRTVSFIYTHTHTHTHIHTHTHTHTHTQYCVDVHVLCLQQQEMFAPDSSLDMEFLDVLTEGLEKVLMVRGGGREVITLYS